MSVPMLNISVHRLILIKIKKLVIDSMFRCTYLKLNKIQINFKIDKDK